MKTFKALSIAVVFMLGTSTAHAQFGNLVSGLKKAKETVDDVNKKRNGDVEFTKDGKVQGFFRTRTKQFIFNQKHSKGDREGKNIIYTIEKNGDITFDDGRKIGEIKDNGEVNCHDEAPYLTVKSDGSVMMDGEKVARIDDQGKVYLYDVLIGSAPGIDKQYAAYLYLGIYYNKERLAQVKEEMAEKKRKEAEEIARIKAEAARRQAQAAQNAKTAAPAKSSQNNTQKKVREYRIEKGSARGFVDENGVVYNWSHTKVGQLPKGSGDIQNGSGSRIGSIWSGDIKDSSGNLLCTVSSGGSIAVKGSNATVAEVRGAGRVDMVQGSKTLGYCDCGNYVWTAAIIFCDLFKF